MDSASVILLREHAGRQGAAVLLARRHMGSSSFAGAFVFPGGHVDGGDTEPSVVKTLAGVTPEEARRVAGSGGESHQALPFFATAIRELFEEAGVLLAENANGTAFDSKDPTTSERLAASRAAVAAGETPFKQFLAQEALRLNAGALVYFSRWITPVTAPSRFDTRFFVALMPPGQEPLQDGRETTEVAWLHPSAALEDAARSRILLFPPTARILEELAQLGSASSIIAAARARRVEPILPKVVSTGGSPVILLPGDAAYDGASPGQEITPGGTPLRRMGVAGGGWRTIT